MNKKIIGVIFVLMLVIVPVVCVGGTYMFLKEDFEEKQMEYETDISKLEKKYENLVGEFEENNDSRLMYEKLMFKGVRKNVDGDYSYGYAESDFYDARYNYDESDFEWAIYYFDSCDVTYASANNYYKEAEAYFKSAIEYAPNDSLEDLARLMKNESMYGAQICSALHQNCEYMSSVSDSYNNGNYDIGDDELETANTFINEHDSLIPKWENSTSDINALLDTLN